MQTDPRWLQPSRRPNDLPPLSDSQEVAGRAEAERGRFDQAPPPNLRRNAETFCIRLPEHDLGQFKPVTFGDAEYCSIALQQGQIRDNSCQGCCMVVAANA